MAPQLKIYRGKFPGERPTNKQIELLKKMGVVDEIIQNCDRFMASIFIREQLQRHYDRKFRRNFRFQNSFLKW